MKSHTLLDTRDLIGGASNIENLVLNFTYRFISFQESSSTLLAVELIDCTMVLYYSFALV